MTNQAVELAALGCTDRDLIGDQALPKWERIWRRDCIEKMEATFASVLYPDSPCPLCGVLFADHLWVNYYPTCSRDGAPAGRCATCGISIAEHGPWHPYENRVDYWADSDR